MYNAIKIKYMAYIPSGYKKHTLTVNDIYFICSGMRISEAELIRTTKRGFNFVDIRSNKILFKGHFYPIEKDREVKKLNFILPSDFIINKKDIEKNDIEIRDVLIAKKTDKERLVLIYNWIRSGYITIKQFENLIYFIK
jgi:hypothetical protein